MKGILKDGSLMGVYMKIKHFLLYCCLFTILFCSCDIQIVIGGGDGNGGGSGGGSGGVSNPTNEPPRTFWAQNLETKSFYSITADLLAENENCRVWAERGNNVTKSVASSIANEYEEKILPKMLETFAYNGPITNDGETIIANNTLELANWIVGGDGKMIILLLDIRDDYKPRENESYCAGYYWSGNSYKKVPSHPDLKYSNECSMIYIDTYPGEPGSEESYTTIAHELQHLMSHTNYYLSEKQNYLDVWIDEGLSSAAEWLYLGEQVDSRVGWYNSDPSGLIKQGNNFFVWGNRENENLYANLDDYSTVYLFFQWLRLQSGSKDIYKEITLSDYYNHLAVASAANRAMGGNGYDDWGTLLKTWLAANYINASSGPYGYKNDSVLKNIKAKTAPGGVTNISLAPGEGVYSITNSFSMPGNKQSVRYAGLNKSGNVLSDTATFSGGALLTYNANTNIKGGAENGTTTGVAASYAEADASGRSVVGVSFSVPYAIGAGDILRRNGFEMPSPENEFSENKFSFGLTKPTKRITISE